jgi:hypothetical protein
MVDRFVLEVALDTLWRLGGPVAMAEGSLLQISLLFLVFLQPSSDHLGMMDSQVVENHKDLPLKP